MNYGADWTPPWREADQARCQGPACTADGSIPGPLCIASTLDEHGRCAACARTVDDAHTLLSATGSRRKEAS